jgi:multisubunit Na+/H+ antiporter MnhB subunit
MSAQPVAPTAVLVTTVAFALFLSVTAHVAARNVLGDVDPRRALYVGPLPAITSVVGGGFSIPAAVTVTVALALDAVMFRWSYEQPPRVVAVLTLIHAVVTVLVGVVFAGIALLLSTRPG